MQTINAARLLLITSPKSPIFHCTLFITFMPYPIHHKPYTIHYFVSAFHFSFLIAHCSLPFLPLSVSRLLPITAPIRGKTSALSAKISAPSAWNKILTFTCSKSALRRRNVIISSLVRICASFKCVAFITQACPDERRGALPLG
ncbi:hypothetical protein CLV93_1055 [Prolixibacter denitrificans]|uniref:Uncharacterized protein n=1 Tax=Prolixibacter denitrificans TaxID=1541063 RepID=A0A2P8CCB7_9BACT|nr:hypothetical protein CLV93_1055 [Prolixibacter denitrificans]